MDFLRVNNQTLQKTYIKPYLFIYLAFNVQKTHGKSRKILLFSTIFRVMFFSQIIGHRNLHTVKNGPRKYAFKWRAASMIRTHTLGCSSIFVGGETAMLWWCPARFICVFFSNMAANVPIFPSLFAISFYSLSIGCKNSRNIFEQTV